MRWADERYVRVYTRDTGEWLALGWEAQALCLFALRKADRAGIIQTGKARARGLAGMTGMPLDVVERVLPLLLDDGCLREAPNAYIIPNFIAAQETPTSDAQRKRDQRERDRDKAVADGASGSRAGLDVEGTMSRRSVTTDGHAGASRHGVTQDGHATESQEVTAGHAGTVTPNCTVPNRAKDLPAPEGREVSPQQPALFEQPAHPPTSNVPRKARQRPTSEPKGDPRHQPLVEALVAAAPGYAFLGGQDAKAVKRLLELADSDAMTRGDKAPGEVVRRWRICRAWVGFPASRHLGDFATNWNSYARPQAPPGVRPGRMDTTPSDFSKPPEGEGWTDLPEYTLPGGVT
jgi:hypothetical protein